MNTESGRENTSSSLSVKQCLQGLSQDALESMISHFVKYCGDLSKEKQPQQQSSSPKSSNTIFSWKGKEMVAFFCREYKLLLADSQRICNLFLYPFQVIKPVLWKPNKHTQQVEMESSYCFTLNRSAVPILPFYTPSTLSPSTPVEESNVNSSPTTSSVSPQSIPSEPPSPALPPTPNTEPAMKKQHFRTQSMNHMITVCVIGSGHNIIAYCLVKYLVERNYKVKIAVDHVKYCKQIFAPLFSSLEESMIEFVEASLEKKKSFDHILAGVSCVILCDFPKHILQ